MASADAVRALRSILRSSRATPQLQQQRRTICAQCLARPGLTRGKRQPRSRHSQTSHPQFAGPGTRKRYATIAHAPTTTHGPIAEYDRRVRAGLLRDDDHQRTLIQALQKLHDALSIYNPPPIVAPTVESLKPKKSLFGSIFGGDAKKKLNPVPDIPNLPKGMYMYGDVGSGKTMMMDLFYDTLPPNIKSKRRIHFHNFMQGVHKEVHKAKIAYGDDADVIPFVAAEMAGKATVLCFDEFQCTDVADAMILRRLVEALMSMGTILIATSNRHPTELYKNGVQRESFVPCINLLCDRLEVLNLDSQTDYRKLPRPSGGVYHHPLDAAANQHAERWFQFFGDFEKDPPHPAVQHVWGREIQVPRASGRACHYTFSELIGRATGAADYLELVRSYDAFIVTDVPGMNLRTRDLARRFITFLDAVYEARAKLVLTTSVPLAQIFMSRNEVDDIIDNAAKHADQQAGTSVPEGEGLDDSMRMLMDDLGMNMDSLKKSSIFTGDEEAFAFARALSRLTEMGSQHWIDHGMSLEDRKGEATGSG